MRTVHKYELATQVGDAVPVTVQIPSRGKVIHVDQQHGAVTIWVDVNEQAELVERTFIVVGTGRRVPPWATYVGSALLREGHIVGHVFEVKGV